MSGSVEINAFPPNHAVTIFWLTAHALHLRGFSIFLSFFDPDKQSRKGRVFSNSITFNTVEPRLSGHRLSGLFLWSRFLDVKNFRR